ncbi:hypothetical protein AB0G05_19595 [Nonomuraea wenchangensis]
MGMHTSGSPADTLKAFILKAGDPRLSEALDDPPSEGYTMLLVGDHDQFVIDGSHIEIAAIVRRLAVEARHRFAGSGVSTRPKYPLHVDAVAAQLQHLGLVPDEDGALLAAGQIIDHLRGNGFDVATRADEPSAPEPEPLPVLWPNSDVTLDLLEPGRVVQRYPERSRGGRAMAQAPCCERWVCLPAQPGADEEPPEEGVAVFCNACKILYQVRWLREPDEGWGPSWIAQFEVVHTKVATASGNYRKATTS